MQTAMQEVVEVMEGHLLEANGECALPLAGACAGRETRAAQEIFASCTSFVLLPCTSGCRAGHYFYFVDILVIFHHFLFRAFFFPWRGWMGSRHSAPLAAVRKRVMLVL
jgi:hypothetical protein